MRKIALLLVLILGMAGLARAQQRKALSASSGSTTCTFSSCLTVSVDPTQGGATFTISANASGNTISFMASGDGGTTLVPLTVTPSNSSTSVTTTTSTGTWQANTSGYTNIYMIMTNLVSGTTTVSIIQSTASARGGSSGGNGGAVVNCSQANGIAYNNGTTNSLSCDAGFEYNSSVKSVILTGNGGGSGTTMTVSDTSAIAGNNPIAVATQAAVTGTGSSSNEPIGVQGSWNVSGAANLTVAIAGVLGIGQNGGSGTIAAARDFDAGVVSNIGGGTITNVYSYYSPAQTVGGTNYGFYDAGVANKDQFQIMSAQSLNLSGLTASSGVCTDASKNLTSVGCAGAATQFNTGATTLTNNVLLGVTTNATLLAPFYLFSSVSTLSNIFYDATLADNTANVYDIGIYGPNCLNGATNVPLVAHTGAQAGTVLFNNTGALHAALTGAPVTVNMVPGYYCIAYTSSAVSPAARMGGETTGRNVVPFANATAPAGGTGTTSGGVLNNTITAPALSNTSSGVIWMVGY